jgi:hypothetical protein
MKKSPSRAKMSDLCDRIQVSTYKRTKMIDTTDPLLNELAEHFVELHGVGGIELEQWETAYKFVKHFYHTEEMVQIVIRSKKV